MLFKDISYPELWLPLPSVQPNHLCCFGRRHYEEHLCEIDTEFGLVVKEEMTFLI